MVEAIELEPNEVLALLDLRPRDERRIGDWHLDVHDGWGRARDPQGRARGMTWYYSQSFRRRPNGSSGFAYNGATFTLALALLLETQPDHVAQVACG